jgi:hypothetical protein
MVRALLEGRKTQTRRVVKPGTQLDSDGHCFFCGLMPEVDEQHICPPGFLPSRCPYGATGDRLWVRETWGLHGYGDFTCWMRDSVKGRSEAELRSSWELAYAADAESVYDHWRPSIHMPRWASRITLEVTGVRVERLQEITEAAARAEGIEPTARHDLYGWRNYGDTETAGDSCEYFTDPRESFRSLWESINGAESWKANPFCWVVEFRRV